MSGVPPSAMPGAYAPPLGAYPAQGQGQGQGQAYYPQNGYPQNGYPQGAPPPPAGPGYYNGQPQQIPPPPPQMSIRESKRLYRMEKEKMRNQLSPSDFRAWRRQKKMQFAWENQQRAAAGFNRGGRSGRRSRSHHGPGVFVNAFGVSVNVGGGRGRGRGRSCSRSSCSGSSSSGSDCDDTFYQNGGKNNNNNNNGAYNAHVTYPPQNPGYPQQQQQQQMGYQPNGGYPQPQGNPGYPQNAGYQQQYGYTTQPSQMPVREAVAQDLQGPIAEGIPLSQIGREQEYRSGNSVDNRNSKSLNADLYPPSTGYLTSTEEHGYQQQNSGYPPAKKL